jgi:hypothetical protein
MNVSPATLLRPECTALLARLPLDRVLLELSEHDQVEDYTALDAVLQPLRAGGLRLAVDDVGAGFSSLRHIVRTAPGVLELDRTIVDGVAGDPVLRTLVAPWCSSPTAAARPSSPRASRRPRTRPPCSRSRSTSARAGTSAGRRPSQPSTRPRPTANPPLRAAAGARAAAAPTARAARTRTPLDLVVGVTGTPTR